MPAERFYLDVPSLQEKEEVILTGREYHHLVNVMRGKIGDQIELVNGRSQLALATIIFLDKNQAHLHIEIVHKPTALALRKKIILAQAFPRLNRLEFILEKGTELGASAFWLFPGMLGDKREQVTENQVNRLNHIIISAIKQCGRLDLPELIFLPALSNWREPEGTLLFGDTRENAPLIDRDALVDPSPLTIFIGPEAGFHPREIELLEHQWKARGTKFHENILRVDTAALVALTLYTEATRRIGF